MHVRRLTTLTLMFTAGWFGTPSAAGVATRCLRHRGAPSAFHPSEATGYVPLPRGDVFCPLLADPKGQRSFVSYIRETDDDGQSRHRFGRYQ